MNKAILSALALGAVFSTAAAFADEVSVNKDSVSKEESSSSTVSTDPSVKTTTITRDPTLGRTTVTTGSPTTQSVQTKKQKVTAETESSTMDR